MKLNDKFSLVKDSELINRIDDIILEIVDESQEFTRSDLQGMITVKALDIANMVKEYNSLKRIKI
jgi:hypothetical protein